jgi:NAD(P)-dependent dehydrogenase (short-subunit alcohol dehydrogenase family)
MKRFENKTVLVTGGNSGIGLATALQFAKEGARVVITGRDETTLAQAKTQLGANAIAVRNDAGSLRDARDLATLLGAQGISLDAVFINAGVAKFGAFEEIDETLWDQTFNTNVKGAYFTIQALVPLFNPGAAIILNGSINAHIGMPHSSVYAASKAALISFAKTLSADALNEMAGNIQAAVPLKRFGTPDEVAGAVLYLASPEAGFIVGTELIVDGGMIQL